MFIVKLIKYDIAQIVDAPSQTSCISIRECNAVHLRYEVDGRQVLQLGDAPGGTMEMTVGSQADCSYSVAFVMNAQGKTVETIR